MAHATPWFRAAGIAWLGLAVPGTTVWGALALYFSDLPLRIGLAVAFAFGTLGAFLFLPNRRRTLLGFGIALAALLLWWSWIEPSNERDWQPEVARLPYASRDGERITLHNVRNFDYRTEQDFVARPTSLRVSIEIATCSPAKPKLTMMWAIASPAQ